LLALLAQSFTSPAIGAEDPLRDKLKTSKSKIHFDCGAAMDIFNKENRTLCRGGAWIKRDDFTIRCNMLEVLTDDKHNPKRFTCVENVSLQTADGQSKSEKAEYDAEKELLTLTGNPSLKRGDSLVRGETIIYDLKNERLRIFKPRGALAPDKKQ
jgi:lipopolysaccharide transport protein LptA